MKLAKRFLALAMVAVMLVSSCLVAGAASATIQTWTEKSTYTIDNAVTYSTYTVKGSSSGNSTTAHVLEFDPADGYVPMAFTGSAGNVLSISEQYAAAVAQGYEVAGVINGSFFDMSRHSINQALINENKLISADPNDQVGALATFDAEGNMGFAYSVLHFDMVLDGRSITDAIGAVNKRYQYIANTTSTSEFINRFFYYDNSAVAGDLSSTSANGYEILCEKVDYTELSVGETLKAKVLSVNSGRNYGTTIPTDDDQFVLFVKSDSGYATYASALSAGDELSISTWESSSTAAMNDAYTAMSSCYYLVKNGVDQCASSSYIGHSVNGYARPWTAFGQKADGSFVYFISTGEKMDLADVSAAMIKLGCVNVFRLDGGGSTAMYVNGKGAVYDQGRDIADCLLIVKKSSMDDPALTEELQTAVDTAKTIASPNADIVINLAAAEELLAKDYPAKGLVKEALSNLNMKTILESLIETAEAEDSANYSAEDYALLQSAITSAKNTLASSSSGQTQYKTAIDELSACLALSQYKILSVGKDYTTEGGTKYNYWGTPTDACHDDGIRLTDGSKGNTGLFTSAYSAWQTKNTYIDDGAGSYYLKVTVDLGEQTTSNVYAVYTGAITAAGISNPGFVSVWGSNSATGTFTVIGSCDTNTLGTYTTSDGEVILNSYTFSTTEGQDYRYIEFHIYPNQYGSSFLWVDEVEVALDETLLPEEETPVNPDVLVGDVNADGKLNGTDYLMLKRIVMGSLDMANLKEPETALTRCDTTGDGKVVAVDYFKLKRMILS